MNSSMKFYHAAVALGVTLCLVFAGCIESLQNNDPEPDPSTFFPPPDTMQASLRIDGAADARFTPDGKGLIVANASEGWGRVVATYYDLATGEAIRTFDPYPSLIQSFHSMAVSNDGRYLVAAGSFKGMITGGPIYPGFIIWEIATGKIVENSLDLATDNLPSALVFAPGDSIFIGAYDGMLIAYKTEPKHLPPHYLGELDSASFSDHTFRSLHQLSISPTGRYILSNESLLWDLSNRSLAEDFSETRKWYMNALAFRGDDKLLVGGNSDGVYLYSLDQNKPLKRIKDDYMTQDHLGYDPDVMAVASTPDGKLIAATDDQARLKVWTADSSRPVAFGKSNLITEFVYFSPDSKRVVTISREDIQSDDRTIHVWMLPVE